MKMCDNILDTYSFFIMFSALHPRAGNVYRVISSLDEYWVVVDVIKYEPVCLTTGVFVRIIKPPEGVP